MHDIQNQNMDTDQLKIYPIVKNEIQCARMHIEVPGATIFIDMTKSHAYRIAEDLQNCFEEP